MRILLVHNFYGSSAPSGENQVFEAEKLMLQRRGHEVFELVRHSDEIRVQGALGALKGALSTPWNPWMAARAQAEVQRLRPDVVHVHNTFPLISPAVFHAIGSNAARVLTLHNYRLLCPAAVPMRRGLPCTECMDQRSSVPAVRHGCYRNSRVATVPLAVSVSLHRRLGTWQRQVDAFIAFSEFQRLTLIAAGLPADKLFIKPNFYPGVPEVVPWQHRGSYLVFAGRLTAEKGVATLVKAWRELSLGGEPLPELRIVGDGPLRQSLEEASKDLPITFTGALSMEDAQLQIARARLLLIPSESLEGFPMVLREAFAFGTPVAATNLGPMPELVRQGWSGVLFEPGRPDDAARVVQKVWQAQGALEQLSAGARREYEIRYTEAANHDILMNIYMSAIASKENLP